MRRGSRTDELARLLGVRMRCNAAGSERARDRYRQNRQGDFLPKVHSATSPTGFQATKAMSARLFTTRVINATSTVMVTNNGRSRSRAARQASCPTPGVSQITSMGMDAPNAKLTEIPARAASWGADGVRICAHSTRQLLNPLACAATTWSDCEVATS